mgnify:CR=1 FL=1
MTEELQKENVKTLKKIYKSGNVIIDNKEINILFNAITEYRKVGFNKETEERIELLRGKLLMLWGKDKARLSKETKKFINIVTKK